MSTPLLLQSRSLAGPESLACGRTKWFPRMAHVGRFGRRVRRLASLARRGCLPDNRPAPQPQEGSLGRPALLESPAPFPLVSQSSNAALPPVTTWRPSPIVHVSPSSLRSVTWGASAVAVIRLTLLATCLLYTSPSPRDGLLYRMPSS